MSALNRLPLLFFLVTTFYLSLIHLSPIQAQTPNASAAPSNNARPNANPDPVAIIRRSVDRDWTDFEQRKNYTYQQTLENRQLDKLGKVEHTESQTHEIMILAGRPYERLIARDGTPLSEKDSKKEQAKLDRELASRLRESPSDRARDERERINDRRFIAEIPEAFNFRLITTELVSGQPAWVIEIQPKPGYRPKQSEAKMFTKVRAKIWIEQATYHWVKLDADVLDTLSFGLGLMRIAPGATVHFEQTRINNEIWLPSSILIRADARLVLVKKVRAEIDIRYSNYKKFQTDSRIEDVKEQSK